MHGWAREVIGAVGKPQTTPEEYLSVFFASSPSSRKAGQEALGRMYSRTEDRDAETTWAVRLVCPFRPGRLRAHPSAAENHRNPMKTFHLRGGNPGCYGGPDHSLPPAAEESNLDE